VPTIFVVARTPLTIVGDLSTRFPRESVTFKALIFSLSSVNKVSPNSIHTDLGDCVRMALFTGFVRAISAWAIALCVKAIGQDNNRRAKVNFFKVFPVELLSKRGVNEVFCEDFKASFRG